MPIINIKTKRFKQFMKKLILFVGVLLCVISCSAQVKTDSVNLIEKVKVLTDSIQKQNEMISILAEVSHGYKNALTVSENKLLTKDFEIKYRDSVIADLKLKVMNESRFVQLYKYQRLLKYYNLCKSKSGVPFKSKYAKYYNGWSTRVFELK